MAFIPAVNHAFTVALGWECVFHDRVNPFYRFNDHQFKQRFCIRKETAEDLMILLPELYRPTKHSHALEESLQLCVVLRFLADGCYFLTVVDTVHISEASVHRIVKKVVHGLNQIAHTKLIFPGLEGLACIKDEFYLIAGMYVINLNTISHKMVKASKCTLRFCTCLTCKPVKLAVFWPNPSNQVNAHSCFVLA